MQILFIKTAFNFRLYKLNVFARDAVPAALIYACGLSSELRSSWRQSTDELCRPAKRFLGDKAYDADWLRDGFKDRGIRPCIPPPEEAQETGRYNKRLYRKHYRIENAFGLLKDWCGIATRYERCGDIFLSAIILAAIVIFWL